MLIVSSQALTLDTAEVKDRHDNEYGEKWFTLRSRAEDRQVQFFFWDESAKTRLFALLFETIQARREAMSTLKTDERQLQNGLPVKAGWGTFPFAFSFGLGFPFDTLSSTFQEAGLSPLYSVACARRQGRLTVGSKLGANPGPLSKWLDRYFVLTTTKFQYYDRPPALGSEGGKKGEISLAKVTSVYETSQPSRKYSDWFMKTGHYLSLETAERTYQLRFATAGEAGAWLAAIEHQVEELQAAPRLERRKVSFGLL